VELYKNLVFILIQMNEEVSAKCFISPPSDVLTVMSYNN
jgi:hypothetical protein